jgi:Tol biopolymer transport system component/predicted Ser/Thr protein kinase
MERAEIFARDGGAVNGRLEVRAPLRARPRVARGDAPRGGRAAGARWHLPARATILPGVTPTRIGPYPIERELGRGGMGVVYLGEDPRLKRPVAIKVLPDAFALDPDRLARFEREARLLAALTHPNIAGIYGLEEDQGRRFLVLEYVEGETLAQHQRGRGLSLEETLDVCRQIAAALEAAHEAGIVHRDLKPGNVKLTPAGEVKVLDFGLAKGASSGPDSSPDLTHSPTLTQAATGVGVILGTAAYMSPEQARGKTVDRRTDIWSFGCVLYESLTGAQAFAGETVSDTIALILQGEPDWSRLPGKLPEKLRTLLGRCLEKDARRRLRDIGDARIELEELQGARVSGTPRASAAAVAAAATPAARRAGALRGAAIALAGLAAGALLWRALAPQAPVAPYRFVVAAPGGAQIDGDAANNVISPDGTNLAFVASDSSGQSALWVRAMGTFEARPLRGTAGATLPFWSPDGRQIGFFADGKLRRMRLSSGTSEVICEAPNGRGASWSRSGVIVFTPSPGGPLYQVRSTGGTPQAVTVLDSANGQTAHRWPCFLPDGEHFLYAALPAEKNGQYACYVGSVRSREHRLVLKANGAPVFAAPQYLIFQRGEVLLAQRFDRSSRQVTGDPFSIGNAPGATIFSGHPCVSASNNGVLAWQSGGSPDTRVLLADRTGHIIRALSIPVDRWNNIACSPDGRHAILQQSLASGDVDLWTADLTTEVANRITFGQGVNSLGTFSPDGREILYTSTREGSYQIFRRASDGSGSDREIPTPKAQFKYCSVWSPDGKWVLLQLNGDKDGWNLVLQPLDGGQSTPWLVTPFDELNSQLSPDGKWCLYTSNESGTSQLYVQSFPVPGHKRQISRNGAFGGTWGRGGREILIYQPDLGVEAVAVTPGPELTLGAAHELFRFPQDWRWGSPLPDDEHFLILQQAAQSAPGISIAVNWIAGAEK